MLTFLKKFLSLRPKTIPEKPEVPHKVEALSVGAEASAATPVTVPAAKAVIVVPDAVVPAAVIAKPKAEPKPKAPAKPKPKAPAKPKPRAPAKPKVPKPAAK